MSYTVAARGLAAGRGYVDLAGHGLTLWPPGYPALLAGGLQLNLSIEFSARLINATSAALLVWTTYVLASRVLSSRTHALAACAIISVSPALLRTEDSIWSEPVFCVLTLTFLLLLDRAMSPRHRASMLALAGVVAGTATLVRFIGLSLVIAGALFIPIVLSRRLAPATRYLAAFLAPAAVLIGPWIVRNHSVDGTWFGPRVGVGPGVRSAVDHTLVAVGRLVAPEQVSNSLLKVVVVASAVLAIVAFLWSGAGESDWSRVAAPLLVVGMVTAIAAATFLQGGATDLNARILAPTFAPLVVIAIWLYDKARDRISDRRRPSFSNASAVAAGVGLVGLALWSGALALSHGRQARGYAALEVRDSASVRMIADAPRDALVLTDEPLSAAFWIDRPIVGMGDSAQVDAGTPALSPRAALELACGGRVVYVRASSAGEPAVLRFDAIARAYVSFNELDSSAGATLFEVQPVDTCARS